MRDSFAGKRKNALKAEKRVSGELAAKDREKADFEAAAPGAKAKSASASKAAPAPGIPEGSRQLARRAAPAQVKKAASREARVERKENLRADSDLRQGSGNSAPGVAGKAASGGRPKVRVEIRFRIVAD